MTHGIKTSVRRKMMEALNPHPANDPRLLVIEDNPSIRESLHLLLGPDYEVVGLSSGGDDILQELDRYRPNLIVMDVNLPGRDGFSLCEIIRSSARHRHIPVVFLTVLKDDVSFVRFLKAYGDAYLNKPFEVKELRGTIRRLLNAVQ